MHRLTRSSHSQDAGNGKEHRRRDGRRHFGHGVNGVGEEAVAQVGVRFGRPLDRNGFAHVEQSAGERERHAHGTAPGARDLERVERQRAQRPIDAHAVRRRAVVHEPIVNVGRLRRAKERSARCSSSSGNNRHGLHR